jgi:hypothetical protein
MAYCSPPAAVTGAPAPMPLPGAVRPGTAPCLYGGFDDDFGPLGHNFFDAVENMLEGRDLIERL